MLYIVQLNVKKRLSYAITRISEKIYSSDKLKIHPVEAESEDEAIEKVKKYYTENKPEWKITIIDSEKLIS